MRPTPFASISPSSLIRASRVMCYLTVPHHLQIARRQSADLLGVPQSPENSRGIFLDLAVAAVI